MFKYKGNFLTFVFKKKVFVKFYVTTIVIKLFYSKLLFCTFKKKLYLFFTYTVFFYKVN